MERPTISIRKQAMSAGPVDSLNNKDCVKVGANGHNRCMEISETSYSGYAHDVRIQRSGGKIVGPERFERSTDRCPPLVI